MKISHKSRKYLLDLARSSIEGVFKNVDPDFGEVPDDVTSIAGVFVTLKIDGRLRGCIGNIEGESPVYKAVSRNAILAAFQDPRFEPLSRSELQRTVIEVSVLSSPERVLFSSPEELVSKISVNKPGLIIKYGANQATYLPQVWEDLPEAEEFISSLCVKAGMSSDFWRSSGKIFDVFTYNVIKFSEENVNKKK
ncbi:AmmeMemoRadiSam system protein A [Candidatus Dojkabacteria bacterium]|nr:AmmeMemoRadiSam system protein A [Candidatus Dojkabacteria bacterium]